jgi:nitrate reductase beta subunit
MNEIIRICTPPIYEYRGWLFQYDWQGAWPLRKDGELRKRAGDKFWSVVEDFQDDPDQEQFRVGGGCITL